MMFRAVRRAGLWVGLFAVALLVTACGAEEEAPEPAQQVALATPDEIAEVPEPAPVAVVPEEEVVPEEAVEAPEAPPAAAPAVTPEPERAAAPAPAPKPAPAASAPAAAPPAQAPAQPAARAVAAQDPDPELGKKLYMKWGCYGCHGSAGGGGMGPALNDAQWYYGGTEADIFTSIKAGRPKGMPAWADKLSDEEIRHMVAFIRSLNAG